MILKITNKKRFLVLLLFTIQVSGYTQKPKFTSEFINQVTSYPTFTLAETQKNLVAGELCHYKKNKRPKAEKTT